MEKNLHWHSTKDEMIERYGRLNTSNNHSILDKKLAKFGAVTPKFTARGCVLILLKQTFAARFEYSRSQVAAKAYQDTAGLCHASSF